MSVCDIMSVCLVNWFRMLHTHGGRCIYLLFARPRTLADTIKRRFLTVLLFIIVATAVRLGTSIHKYYDQQ